MTNDDDNHKNQKKKTADDYILEPNRSVFLWICDLMTVVAEKEDKNRMSDRALSIVFAPSLWEAQSGLGWVSSLPLPLLRLLL